MLRSILVALDDTPGAQAARDIAFGLARRLHASLTVAVVLDRPHTAPEHEAVPMGAGAFKARRDARRTEAAAREADQALADCAAAAGALPYHVVKLEDAPGPALVRAGATHDLLVIGRDSSLGQEQPGDQVAPVIETLLRDGARPLLVVPPGAAPARQGPVLAAYDGSPPAREAFHLFALLRLDEGSPVRVAAVAADRAEALAMAEEGVASLRQHGVAAEALPIVGGHPGEVLLAEVEALGARLMVMGAFGGSSLIRMLVGSTTDILLRDARVPVLIHR